MPIWEPWMLKLLTTRPLVRLMLAPEGLLSSGRTPASVDKLIGSQHALGRKKAAPLPMKYWFAASGLNVVL